MMGRLFALARNLLTALVALAVSAGVLEGVVRAFDLFARQRSAIRTEVPPVDEARARAVGARIHPFLGWSMPPRKGLDDFLKKNHFFPQGKPSDWVVRNSYFNVFGYRSAISDYRSLREDQYVVGVFGGSLAAQLAIVGGDRLTAYLEQRYPRLKGRVVVLNLGGGGYKQPQQVNTLVEMIMLGVPFDLILNVDGLNEVVFGGRNAHYHRVHPFFPTYETYRDTLSFGTGSVTNAQVKLAAAILEAKDRSSSLAELGRTTLLRHSEVAAAFLGSLALIYQERAKRFEGDLERIEDEGGPPLPLAEIPDPCLGKPGGCWQLIADLWGSGSELMRSIAVGFGARYAHFLQPNQYVPGSKRLSPREREVAYLEESPFRRNVPPGYPRLQSRGEQLRAHGVAYYDLSGIFKDVPETLYVDNCCHLNATGYDLLAAAIVERLDDDLESRERDRTLQ